MDLPMQKEGKGKVSENDLDLCEMHKESQQWSWASGQSMNLEQS